MVAQREEVEELEKLHSVKRSFIERESQVRNQLMADMRQMKRRLKAELQMSTKDFQLQLDSLKTKLEILRLQEKQANESFENANGKSDKLRQAFELAKERYEKLRRRNALEMEGFNNEANRLRSRFRQLEKLC